MEQGIYSVLQENVYLHIEKGQARNKPQFISQPVNISIIKISKPCPLAITLFFCDKISLANVSLLFLFFHLILCSTPHLLDTK